MSRGVTRFPSFTAQEPPAFPLNTNLGAGAPTSGLFLGTVQRNFAIDFFITGVGSQGVGKLLSKPKVITQNNRRRPSSKVLRSDSDDHQQHYLGSVY